MVGADELAELRKRLQVVTAALEAAQAEITQVVGRLQPQTDQPQERKDQT